MDFKMPDTKEGLRRTIISFLRQRKKFAELALQKSESPRLNRILVISGSLILKFNLIQNYNYWRHCLEVKNRYNQIYQILPSENGKQKSIRTHMIQLMDECKKISSINYKDYAQANWNKENCHHRSKNADFATV